MLQRPNGTRLNDVKDERRSCLTLLVMMMVSFGVVINEWTRGSVTFFWRGLSGPKGRAN